MSTRWRNRVLSVMAVLVVAVVLNPSEAKHISAIRKEMRRTSPIFEGVLGLGALTSRLLRYDSFLLFSRTSYNGETFSTGAMGMVFVSSSAEKLAP